MRYLSPEWLDAAAAAVAGVAAPPGAGAVIAQRVTGGPEGTIEYRLVVSEGRCRLVVGAEPPASVTLTTPYPVAARIAAGSASAQEAVLDGTIRISGDPTVLVTHAQLAVALAAAVRSTSTDLPGTD